MSSKSLSNVTKSIQTSIKKHSPEILTGLGIAGMVTTTILAVKATPKAIRLVENRMRDEGVTDLNAIETVKTTWKCYIPAMTIGVISIGCLIGATSENLRRNAALAAAYTISESALKEYKNKVVEEIGEKKEKVIRDAIAKDHIDKNPVSKNEVIFTDKGDTLCYDKLSGRYFRSDIEKIKKAENEMNRQMRYENYISLNEFYYELGLGSIKIGDDIGWNIDSGYIDLNFSSQLSENGTPCLVVDYNVAPRYEYR